MAVIASNVQLVKSSIILCEKSIDELNFVAEDLKRKYAEAGSSGWTDSKYKALGNITENCETALKAPMQKIEDCKGQLKSLLKALEAYESTNI